MKDKDKSKEQLINELREHKERFRIISSSVFEAIIMMDDEGKVTFWNEAAEKMFGYAKEEIIGENLHKFIVPKRFYEDFLKGFGEFKNTGGGIIVNKIISMYGLKKDGTEFLAEHSFSSVKIKGKWHALAILRDITDRIKAEKILQEQKKALEQKNLALHEILGQIEIEKKQIKDNVIANAENLLLPVIQKLRLKGESRKYVQLLKENLRELTSSFGARLTEKETRLTSREIDICNMIKNGLTSKEIASLLNITLRTTEKHRANIRNKLGIIKKDINLTSYLNAL